MKGWQQVALNKSKSLFRWNEKKNMPGFNGTPLPTGFGNEIT